MSRKLFWLDDRQWSRVSGIISQDASFPRMIDDRRALSGIIYVLKSGSPWADCPGVYGPHRLLLWRYRRWQRLGLWGRIAAALIDQGIPSLHAVPFKILPGRPADRHMH
ncbi:MAG: transposase [Pseudorhodoplanes sp.]|nr:transposase [Pseudorhodoplanes sp.]MCL4712433.1 transposase [Pseudorhodoplanes sp.]